VRTTESQSQSCNRDQLSLIVSCDVQEQLQSRVADLESQIKAERSAQRDLKLVLAAAEKQSQTDGNEKRHVSLK